MSTKIYPQLKEWFYNATKVVIVGIGNPIRNDDFIGTKIVRQLKNKFSNNIYLIECETVPENYLFDIETFDPSHILLIDAAILNLLPGEIQLVFSEQMNQNYSIFNTHILPIQLFTQYLKKQTNSKIALLLIQPKNIDLGETITTELTKTVKQVEHMLTELLSNL